MNASPILRPACRPRDAPRARAAACLCCCRCCYAPQGPRTPNGSTMLHAGGLYDDNLTRAQQAADVRGDGAATLAASRGLVPRPVGDRRHHPVARGKQRSVRALSWPQPDLDRRQRRLSPQVRPRPRRALGIDHRQRRARRLSRRYPRRRSPRSAPRSRQAPERKFRRLGRRRDRPAICQQRPARSCPGSPASYSICAGTAYSRAPRTTSPSGCRSARACRRAAATSCRRRGRISTSFWRPTRLPPIRRSAATSTPTGCAARPPRPTRP